MTLTSRRSSKHNSAHTVNCKSGNYAANPTLGYESTRLLRDSLNSSGESGPSRVRNSLATSVTRGERVTVAINSFPWSRNHVKRRDSALRSAHESIISRICFRRFAWSENRLSMASSSDFFEAVSRKSTGTISAFSDTFTTLHCRRALPAGVEGPDTNTQVAIVRTTCFGGM